MSEHIFKLKNRRHSSYFLAIQEQQYSKIVTTTIEYSENKVISRLIPCLHTFGYYRLWHFAPRRPGPSARREDVFWKPPYNVPSGPVVRHHDNFAITTLGLTNTYFFCVFPYNLGKMTWNNKYLFI